MESISAFSAGLASNLARFARRMPARGRLGASALAAVAKLKELAPYAAIELILPGGSLMALLLWLYRRQKKASLFATREILSFL